PTSKTIPGTFSGTPTAAQTISLTVGSNTLVLSAVSSGSNSCTSATAGTYVLSATVGTSASNLAAAINSCNSSFSAVGATATSSAGVTTASAVTPGTDITLSGVEGTTGF